MNEKKAVLPRLEGVVQYNQESAAIVKNYLVENKYVSSSGYFLVDGKEYIETEDVIHNTSQVRPDPHVIWHKENASISVVTLKNNKEYFVRRMVIVIPSIPLPSSLFYFLTSYPFNGWIIKIPEDANNVVFSVNNKNYVVDVRKFAIKYCNNLQKTYVRGRELDYLTDFVRLMHLSDMDDIEIIETYKKIYSRYLVIKDLVYRILADSKDCLFREDALLTC